MAPAAVAGVPEATWQCRHVTACTQTALATKTVKEVNRLAVLYIMLSTAQTYRPTDANARI